MPRMAVALAAILLSVSVPASAQTSGYTAVFTPSPDHDKIENQVPVLTSYELQVYAPGGVTVAGKQNIGKPTPVSGSITADVSTVMTSLPASTNCDPANPTLLTCYSATVAAIGPGGSGVSAVSPPFLVGPKAPTAAGRPTVTRR